MIDQLLSVFAPHSCCYCGELGDILCQTCKNDIVSDPFSNCLVCLKPTLDNNLCKSCQSASTIDDAWCVASRQPYLKPLLNRYKFDSATQASAVCIELLDERLPLLSSDITVVAVPTSPSHKRVRGFDHTAIIARNLAKRRQMSYRPILQRIDNGTQHFKTRAQRLQTASSGLIISKNVPERILLIDDIYTTGATIQACTTKLREAGAKHIFVAIIARQTLDDTSDL